MKCIKQFFSLVIVCMVIMLATNSCQPDNLGLYNPVLSASNERDLGNALYDVVLDNSSLFPILNKNEYSEVYDYVAGIMRMVEVKTEIKDSYEWEVLIYHDDSTLNAFTLPGGKILITTGFLKFLTSEHQLFSLIAHEAHYADRIDRTGQGELSLVMQKLKESDKYGTLGTRIFIDVIGGNTNEGVNMVMFAITADYEPFEVLQADKFALDLICDNFLYSAKGIKEMILSVEGDASIMEFDWFENKPPVPTTLINQETSITGPYRQDRIDQIDELLSTCGAENTTQNMSSYGSIMLNLPQ